MPLSLLNIPSIADSIDFLTQPEPTLLPGQVDGYLMPVPSSGSSYKLTHLGCWLWIIAGQQCASSFEITENMTPEQREARAIAARADLVAYVKDRLGLQVRGHVGVVPDCGAIPTPETAVTC